MAAIHPDQSAAAPGAGSRGGLRRRLLPVIRHEEIALLGLLLLVVAFFALAVPTARSGGTYLDLLRESSAGLIAAIGLTLLLLAVAASLLLTQ